MVDVLIHFPTEYSRKGPSYRRNLQLGALLDFGLMGWASAHPKSIKFVIHLDDGKLCEVDKHFECLKFGWCWAVKVFSSVCGMACLIFVVLIKWYCFPVFKDIYVLSVVWLLLI
ncbi:hypothetical protein PVK06_022154 [Gossypium arboreum]|uniref:Uncharacterized protein n=1 Tax=Gossypium arboreum TaxID=29729 RepID=A0ABR0P7P4_GOSAR|nr:hypothetical protein PVK06_022154 [Gossypium arboreum]